MEWLNLTPHEVTILGGENGPVVIPASGQVARVSQTMTEVGSVGVLRIVRSTFGAVVGLPSPMTTDGVSAAPSVEVAETCYIVSAMVRSAVPTRRDVFSPADFVRDEAGKIIGCRAMEVNP